MRKTILSSHLLRLSEAKRQPQAISQALKPILNKSIADLVCRVLD